jgi:hypothetical protein
LTGIRSIILQKQKNYIFLGSDDTLTNEHKCKQRNEDQVPKELKETKDQFTKNYINQDIEF